MLALKIAWATQTKGCIPENSKVKEFEEEKIKILGSPRFEKNWLVDLEKIYQGLENFFNEVIEFITFVVVPTLLTKGAQIRIFILNYNFQMCTRVNL